MSGPDAKKAEIARLFELFERLVSGRPRTTQGSDDAAMDDATNTIPEELNPVLQKLSTIVSARSTGTRPRRNTVASIISPIDRDMTTSDSEGSDEDEEDSLAKFPLADEKKYPFTFRLMVHKLYKKDDWARTIKEMLEKSKNEFMPLAEKVAMKQAKQKEQENQPPHEGDAAGVRFKVVPIPAGGRRGSIAVGVRRRSYSVAGVGPKSYVAISPLPKSPASGEKPEIRALKKRCIGRRKSMGGPLNAGAEVATDISKSRGTWVYDAAVSSSERPVPTTFSTFPPAPPPSPTGASFSRYQPLGTMLPNNLQGKGKGMKRRVSAGDPTMMTAMLTMPPRSTTNTNPSRLVARKRAMTVHTDKDGENDNGRKPMKRPFVG